MFLSSLLSLLTVVAACLRTIQSLVVLALHWVLLWTGVASTEDRFRSRVGEGREEDREEEAMMEDREEEAREEAMEEEARMEAREREEAQDKDSHELDNR